jgi:hypothetical protein
MPEEGMVDALRRARRLLTPGGLVIELHPSASNETVEVGDRVTGFVDAGAALRRHSAATHAIEAAVFDRLFSVAATRKFDFFTYGDSIDELRDYIVENWRDARIADDTVERTRAALHAERGSRPRVREHVQATRLLPIR